MEQDWRVYRVRAHNIAADSENKIHDDTVARQYGFAGGLVPGIVVFGYLTRPVVERFGTDWLARGCASARFVQPCYEDEEITVQAELQKDAAVTTVTLTAQRPDGSVCARGTATFPPAATAALDVAAYPTALLPDDPPPASASALVPGTRLGSIGMTVDERSGSAFAAAVRDDLPLYRRADGAVHPALLLGLANHILVQNVRLGPWIHTASEVTQYSVARYGDTLSLRGVVAECFERKGHEFVVLDLLMLAEPSRPIQHIRHTAIYKPRAVA